MRQIFQTVILLFCVFFTCSIALASGFHVLVNNKQQGPVSMDQLQQMVSDGTLTKDTMVWKDGMPDWAKVGEQGELQNLFVVSSVPQPPPVSSAPPTPPNSSNTVNSVSQNDVDELNTMSDPKSVQSASDDMDDWFDSVFQRFNIEEGEDNGKFVVTASQSVMLKPTDPQYGDTYVNAFDKAMAKLQNKYLMIRFGSTITEKIKSLYSDRSTHAKEIELPPVTDLGYLKKVLAVLEKGLDVTEKKLDQQLIELGTDPQELTKLNPTQKKDIFRDKFVQNTIRRASGSIAGLFPIQTNVITDSKGVTIIGVVAIASNKTIQIAKDITLQRKSIITGRGRDISSLLPKTNEEYLGTLGVRLAYDQDGSPAIISYGIASYRPDSDDDYINNELKAEAKNAAVSKGDAQIAEIINGRMNAEDSRKTGEEIRKYVEREMTVNADTVEKTIENVIKITTRNAKSSARAKLQGNSTVKKWRVTTKEGHKFVGAVRVWKYSTLQAVNAFNNPQSSQQSSTKKKQQFQKFQQESKPVNTMDDF